MLKLAARRGTEDGVPHVYMLGPLDRAMTVIAGRLLSNIYDGV